MPGIHGVCHNDVFCSYDGKILSYGGGWHDAGDLSQQTLQTCETAYALLEMWNKTKTKRHRLPGVCLKSPYGDFGFVLRCRLGNGYHASSIGLLHWTDGIEGTPDDIHTVRKQQTAYDNFLYAAYEAHAARVMQLHALRDSLAKAPRRISTLPLSKFERDGYDRFPHIMEHTYNTSRSQHHATMSWAASQLFMLTGKGEYGETAASSIRLRLGMPGGTGCAAQAISTATRHGAPSFITSISRASNCSCRLLVSLCESQPRPTRITDSGAMRYACMPTT